MKRWFALFAVLLLAGVVVWRVTRPLEPLEARFNRVQVGMMYAEVEAIMGHGMMPPRSYASMGTMSPWQNASEEVPPELYWSEKGDPRRYWVHFENGRVDRKWVEEPPSP